MLQLKIEALGGYKANHSYLLAGNYEDAYYLDNDDKNKYLVLVTPAVNTQEQFLKIDHFIDKSNQVKNALSELLEKILLNLSELQSTQNDKISTESKLNKILSTHISRGDRNDTITKVYHTLVELRFSSEEIQKKIRELDSEQPSKDVFDELKDIIKDPEDLHIKILFPYNDHRKEHWLIAEIKIHRINKRYNIELTAHDPYGGGKLTEITSNLCKIEIAKSECAQRQFTKNSFNQDQRIFESWYDDHTLLYLLNSVNNAYILPYVFINGIPFIEQLEQLCVLKNSINQDICFVCTEPAQSETHHFVCGILSKDKLLLVNPLGKTQHKDYYQELDKISDLNICCFLSNNIIQKDDQGLFSCGPICIELLLYWVKLKSEIIIKHIDESDITSENGYKWVNIYKILPDTLQSLLDLQPANYRDSIMHMRKQHYELLKADRINKYFNVKMKEDYWDKYCLNANIQIIMNKIFGMNDKNIDMIQIQQTEEYKELTRTKALSLQDQYYFNEINQNDNYVRLCTALEKQIQIYDPTSTLEFNSYESAYLPRQNSEDGSSCGVIVVEDLVNRILGKDLSLKYPYSVGAYELRMSHIHLIESKLGPTDIKRKKYITRNTLENQSKNFKPELTDPIYLDNVKLSKNDTVQEYSKVAHHDEATHPSKLPLVAIQSVFLLAPNTTGIIISAYNNQSLDELLREFLDKDFAKNRLINHYLSENWQKIPLMKFGVNKHPSLSLSDCIGLILSKQKVDSIPRHKYGNNDDSRIKEQNEESTSQEKFNIVDLFNSNQKKVLLIGEMGSGKSLYTRYLATKWAKNELCFTTSLTKTSVANINRKDSNIKIFYAKCDDQIYYVNLYENKYELINIDEASVNILDKRLKIEELKENEFRLLSQEELSAIKLITKHSDEFDYVFHLDLRECVKKAHLLVGTAYRITTVDKLLQLMFTTVPLSHGDLMQLALRNKKVIIMIDFYEQVASNDDGLLDILLSQNQYYCLITSRPEMSYQLSSRIDVIVENHGIPSQSLSFFINRYFVSLKMEDHGRKLIKWFKPHTALQEVCQIPIYLEMLCHLWNKSFNALEQQSDLTKTGIHKIFIDSLIEEHMVLHDNKQSDLRYVVRSNMPEVILSHIFLENVAYYAFQQEDKEDNIPFNIIQKAIENVKECIFTEKIKAYLPYENGISEKILQQLVKLVEDEYNFVRDSNYIPLFDRIIKSGILHIAIKGDSDETTIYAFPRINFCEYFVAEYINHNLNQISIISHYKYNSAWLLVWKMLLGIIKTESNKVNKFFEILTFQPTDRFGWYELNLIIHCLEACNWNINKEYNNIIIKYLCSAIQAIILQEKIDIPITPLLIANINLENILMSAFSKVTRKISNRELFSRREEERDSIEIITTYKVIKMLGEIDELSEKGIDILFDAWRSPHFLIYSAADKSIKRLINVNANVLIKILNIIGPGPSISYAMRGLIYYALGDGLYGFLKCINDPRDSVIEYLICFLNERLTRYADYPSMAEDVSGNLFNVIQNLEFPPEKLVKSIINYITELSKKTIIRDFKLKSYESLFYRGVITTIIKWGVERICTLLDSNQIEDLLLNLLLVCHPDGIKYYSSQLPIFINEMYLKYENETIKILLHHSYCENILARRSALLMMGHLKNPTLEMLRFLLDNICSDNEDIQENAQDSLIHIIEINGSTLLESLIELLSYKEQTQGFIHLLIAKLSKPFPDTIKTLVDLAYRKTEMLGRISFEANREIKNLHGFNIESAQLLYQLYHSSNIDNETKFSILTALAHSQYYEKEILSSLFEELKNEMLIKEKEQKSASDSDSENESESEESKAKIIIMLLFKKKYPNDVFEVLMKYAASSSTIDIRVVALCVLGNVLAPTIHIINLLLASCIDTDAGIQEAACRALENRYITETRPRLCWQPEVEAIEVLCKAALDTKNIKMQIATLFGLARVLQINKKIIETFVKCADTSMNTKVNKCANKILSILTQSQITLYAKEIEDYLLKQYENASESMKQNILSVLGCLPCSSIEGIQFILYECGNSNEKLIRFARAAIIQRLTNEEHKFPAELCDELYVKSTLKERNILATRKKCSEPSLDFDQKLLELMIDACGSPNQKVRTVAEIIIKNIFNYDNNYVKMLESKAKSSINGVKLASLYLLKQIKSKHLDTESINELYKITLDVTEELYMRNAAFDAFSLERLLLAYPIEHPKVIKEYRRRWLYAKLSDNPTAIISNLNSTITFFNNNKAINIKSPYFVQILKDLKKIRKIPSLPQLQNPALEKQAQSFDEKKETKLKSEKTHCLTM